MNDFARYRNETYDILRTISDMNTSPPGGSLQPVIEQLEKRIAR